eukprot:scaffold831_cov268-Pinguiococcus_pyrenoidosus.AAC.4
MASRVGSKASRHRMSLANSAHWASPSRQSSDYRDGVAERPRTADSQTGGDENAGSAPVSARERAMRRSQALEYLNKRRQKTGKVAFGSKLVDQSKTREEIAKRREHGSKAQKRHSYRDLVRDNEQYQEQVGESVSP